LDKYIFHINPIDFIFSGTIVTGLLFVLLLMFTKRSDQAANRFLGLALAIVVLWMIGLPAINIQHHSSFTYRDSPPQFSLILGPLIYFYVLKKTKPEYSFRRRDLIHFSPFFLELVIWFLQTRQNTPAVKQVNIVLLSLAFISITVYLCWSYSLVRAFRRWLKFNADGRDKYQLRGLQRLLVAFGIIGLLWMACIVASHFFYHQPGVILYALSVALTIAITAMGSSAILRPVLSIPANVSLGLPTELAQRGDWLRKAIETGLHYQDPDLSLNSLSKATGVHTHELSRIINLAIGKNFNDLINEYRILDVKRKMQDRAYDRITLFGIAQLAGFNSKSTFNRAFRQITGKSASEYKSELKKVRPNYKLRPEPRFAPVISHQQTTPKWYDDKLNRNFMFKNYLKVAWRNLVRNKAHTFINMAGLSVGLACSLLIMLWVQSEVGMDAFHTNHDSIYQVYERQYFDNKVNGQYFTPGMMAAEIKRNVPEVKYASSAIFYEWHTFKTKENVIKMQGGSADADFFKMFSFSIIRGNAQNALNTLSGVAISEKMANALFGGVNTAMGKAVMVDSKKQFTVTAVFDNVGANSSLKFDYLFNWGTFLENNPWAKEWGNNTPYTYLQLRPDANPVLVDGKITHMLEKLDKVQKKGIFTEELGMQKFVETYLHSTFTNGKIDGGRIGYVRMFSIIAIFILLIACINFMNLTTARSVKRAKEIGVRKVVGALRGGLIKQFISESLLLTTLSVSLALLLLMFALPYFNQITQKEIALPFNNLSFWLQLILVTLITGLVAGSYPALFLSSFNPVKVLKGTLKLQSGTTLFRKGLVVFQFVLSILMITGTIIISRQIAYIQSKNLGFDKENLVFLNLEGDILKKYDVLRNEALKLPGIKAITHSNTEPTSIQSSTIGVDWEGKNPGSQISFSNDGVGYDFISTLKLKLLAGRDFSKDFPGDSAGFIVNQAAVERLGYTDPLGKPLTLWGNKGKIVGVVENFHAGSMHDPIKPLILYLNPNMDYGFALLRIEAGKTKQALAGLETIYKELNPNFPFSYTFANEEFNKLYKSEQMIGGLSDAFAFLAIFISCLGLLGLAMFTAEQRLKEIGIRKVLGASIRSLFTLLSSEFLVLVVIALFIALPTAWYFMDIWLRSYAYHAPIQWWMFAISGVTIIGITLLTVSFQAIKAALVNPIKSLRSE